MTTKTDIFRSLDVLDDYDKDDYQQLNYTKIKAVTKKAVLVDDRWIPKSQMKCDFDQNLYVTLWMYSKLDN